MERRTFLRTAGIASAGMAALGPGGATAAEAEAPTVLFPSAHRAVQLLETGTGRPGELLRLVIETLNELLIVNKAVAIRANEDRLDIFCAMLEMHDQIQQAVLTRLRESLLRLPADQLRETDEVLRQSVLFQEFIAFETYLNAPLTLVPDDGKKQDKITAVINTIKKVVKDNVPVIPKAFLDPAIKTLCEIIDLLRGK